MRTYYILIQIYLLLFSITLFSQTVDKTRDTGEIPCSITPSPSGALNYAIPIEIYPGKNGTQPNLQLLYNSQNLNQFSVLGLGWALGGLSEISRCQASNYYDNVQVSSPIKEGVNVFTLDGLRLVNSNNTNYNLQTEQNNIYVKINADYTKFEVYYPNGTIAYYGNGSHKYSYPITKLVDPLGNYIDYTYTLTDNRFYIEQISYGANQNVKIGEIKFSYAINDFERFVYIDGLNIKTTKRINKVDCYFGNTLLKSYSIDYKKDDNNYFLSKFDCISSGKYLNPLTFGYGDGSRPSIISESKSLPSGNPSYEVLNTIGVNWDSQSPNEGYAILVQDPKTGWMGLDWINASKVPQTYSEGSGPNLYSLLVGDVDGDTNEDIVKINELEPNRDYITLITGPKTISKKKAFYFNIPIADNRKYLLGDFQGNGKAILMVISYGKNTSGKTRNTEVCFIDIENEKILHTDKYYFTILPEDRLELIDFDGDGSVELLHINQTGCTVRKVSPSGGYPLLTSFSFGLTSFRYNKLLIGDINNDGKTDLMFSPHTSIKDKRYVHSGTCHGYCEKTPTTPEQLEEMGRFPVYMGPPNSQCKIIGVEDYLRQDGGNTWTIYFSNGKNAFVTSTFSHHKYYGSNYADYILSDINNDGFLDLIENSSDNRKLNVYYNKGGTFNTNADYTDIYRAGKLTTTKGSHRFGHNKGVAIVDPSSASIIYNQNQENNSLLLSSSVSSLGIITKFEYGKVNSDSIIYPKSVYNQGNSSLSYPWCYVPNAITLLKSIKSTADNAMVSSQTYQYKNGVIHLQGLGFRGFEEIKTTDNIDNTRSKIQIFDPFNWSVLKSEESYPIHVSGNVYNTFYKNTYEYTNTIASNKARVVTLKSKKEEDLLKKTSISTSYTYDTYGNPTKEAIAYEDGINKTINYKYNNLTGSPYILGQLAEKTVVDTRNGSTVSSKTTLLYNTKGQVTSQKSYYGTYQVSEDTYVYDAQNNLSESKSKTYTSANELSTKYQYDNIGRVKRQTDPLGLYNDYTYNTKGELSSVKNHKGQETRYEYDIWGRKLKTTYPDGIVETLKMAWSLYDKDLGNLDPNKNNGDIKIGAPLSQGTTVVACRSISLTPGFSHKAADKGTLSLKIDPNTCSTPPVQTTYNNPLYVVTVTKTGSPTIQTHYDVLGRELRKGELRFDGCYLYTDILYDDKGRMQKESLPFKGTTPALWNTYTYDNYNRITLLSHASGKKDSYAYKDNAVTATIDNVARTTNYNILGEFKSITDPAGTITYNYRADGQPSSIVAPGSVTTSFEYDSYGRQTKIIDPSAGTKTFAYDTAGNISKETDADNRITNTTYDKYNRITGKEVVGLSTTTYAYNTDGLLASISSNNGTGKTFTYDNLMRISTTKETVPDNKWLQKTYAYSGGNIASVAYASNTGTIVTENHIYTNGQLTETKLNNTTSIWKLTQENNLGMPSEAKTGGLTRTYGYDAYGLPTARTIKNGSTVIQNFGYSISAATGNLNWRKDNIRNIQENFTYDKLNRLTGFGGKSIAYDIKGNITDFSTVGKFGYTNSAKPYAVTEITPYGSEIPLREQTITYNGMMRPSSITENTYIANLAYNADGDRVKMQIKKNNADELIRYYIGAQYETDSGIAGAKERLYLGGDAYSAATVYVKEGTGAWTLYYIGRDYLGSITHVINTNGTIKQELSYDPWGRLRNPVNQQNYAVGSEPVLFLARGYTGHEHLAMFGLINMNARLYDPVLGRFLSPDPYVQAPDFSQNFNRYSYALNNPLRFTDPNGEFWHLVIGAVAGGVINWAFNGFEFNMDGLKYFGAGAVGGTLMATGNPLGVFGGGAFTAGANSAIQQYSATGVVNWDQVGISAVVGGATAYIGGAVASKVAPYAESWFSNVSNDVLQKGLAYGTTGAITGATVGGGMGYATTGTLDGTMDGIWKGGALGFGTGFTYGAGGQMYKNYLDGKNWLSGEYKNRLTLDISEDGVSIYKVKYKNKEFLIGGEMNIENDILSIKGFDIDGNSTNQLGTSGVRELTNFLGKSMNVKEIHFYGAPRTTGANPGKTTIYKQVIK